MKGIHQHTICTVTAMLLLSANILAQGTHPVSVKMGTGVTDPVYYQHGYNKSGTLQSPREDRDSVMVGSTMPYFVMPDSMYNSAYIASTTGGDYSKTNLTTSKFTWTVPTSGALASFVTPNAKDGNTSPRVTITWSAASAIPSTDTIRMMETPLEYKGQPIPASSVCPGQAAKIPVTVIPKPTIQFGLLAGKRDTVVCATNIDSLNVATYAAFDFPLTLVTKSAQIEVKYTITVDGQPLYGHDPAVAVKVSDITKLPLKFKKYGKYVITITEITDRIARKCNVKGLVSGTPAENVFTYTVLPQPKTGKTYHVPNNY